MVNNFKFSSNSEAILADVNPDLVRIVRLALTLSSVDFGITERQREILRAGSKSQTMKSRHITGHAVDVVDYIGENISWDWNYYVQIAKAFKLASNPIRWVF